MADTMAGTVADIMADIMAGILARTMADFGQEVPRIILFIGRYDQI
jgi:hypothetical protein